MAYTSAGGVLVPSFIMECNGGETKNVPHNFHGCTVHKFQNFHQKSFSFFSLQMKPSNRCRKKCSTIKSHLITLLLIQDKNIRKGQKSSILSSLHAKM